MQQDWKIAHTEHADNIVIAVNGESQTSNGY